MPRRRLLCVVWEADAVDLSLRFFSHKAAGMLLDAEVLLVPGRVNPPGWGALVQLAGARRHNVPSLPHGVQCRCVRACWCAHVPGARPRGRPPCRCCCARCREGLGAAGSAGCRLGRVREGGVLCAPVKQGRAIGGARGCYLTKTCVLLPHMSGLRFTRRFDRRIRGRESGGCVRSRS